MSQEQMSLEIFKLKNCIVGNEYKLLVYRDGEIIMEKFYTFYKFMDSRDCRTSTTTKYKLWFYSGPNHKCDIMYVDVYIDGSVFIYGDDNRLFKINDCLVEFVEYSKDEYVIIEEEEEEWTVLEVEIN